MQAVKSKKLIYFLQYIHVEMACESCAIKFTLFKRKKQCMDCLLYFCTECVIRRFDRILSCDNCSMLSRRPLIRSQILQMRSKYLRQYLVAKKVNIRGCIEKEDLVNLLIIFANGNEIRSNTQTRVHGNSLQNRVHENSSEPNELNSRETNRQPNEDQEDSPTRRSRSPQVIERADGEVTTPDDTRQNLIRTDHSLEIEEVSEGDNNVNESVDHVNGEPEPVITEQEEASEASQVEHTEMFTEIHMWTGPVKLSDIKEISELEYLTVKQLKDLLSANRVDFKGCVERCELLDRACRLWEEYKKSRKVVETADEEALCKICLDAPIECVILECGHMACCINCGKQMSECPICRQYVVRVVRFFKA